MPDAATDATAASTISDADPWAVTNNGTVRTPAARKMAKLRRVKPAVDKIIKAGSVESQAAVLRAVADHPALAAASKLAGIETSKQLAATKFIWEQSLRMMERARSGGRHRGNTTCEKRSAVEVMLTFCAPSPDKAASAPSILDRAQIIGVPKSTLHRVEKK